MIGIYKIENQINNKKYIGQSVNISKRWSAHRNAWQNPNKGNYNSPLYRSIRNYGLENFSFEVIEECLIETLDEKEIYWINYYDSNNPDKGYNLTLGGNSSISNSIITFEQADEIIELLRSTDISQQEIAEQYGISQRSVSGINLGQSWIKNNESYPIRKKKKKNLEREKYCIDCGKLICSGAVRCEECSQIYSRKVERPTREELKELIRTIPFTQLSERYGVSDNAIRKWCDTYNLPRKKSIIKEYSDEEWRDI